MTYGKNVLIALDQLCNALVGGWPDETLSSRCWRWSRDGVRDWPRKVIDALFWEEQEHCRRAYESECLHLQFPPSMRERNAHDHFGGKTMVTVDDKLLLAKVVAMDVGLPLNVHPKSTNSPPVAPMASPDGYASLFAGRELPVYWGVTAPSDCSRLWLNTNDGTLNYHNGSAWVSIVGRYADA